MLFFRTAALHAALVGAAVFLLPAGGAWADNTTEAGNYIYHLAGCEGCHTDKKEKGPLLAGGRRFETDFGVFYSPNITPDPETGIGDWSFADFGRAMREGVSPRGSHYYPAFPYGAYQHMRDEDLSALWAYLKTVPAVQHPNKPHELRFPFSWRLLLGPWKWLNLERHPLAAMADKSAAWHRGRYIATALSHCQECHTSRNFLGGLQHDMAYAGSQRNPEGTPIPNITPDRETGIGKWSAGDLDMLFKMGMLPDADFVGGVMAEMVTHATSKLNADDRAALVAYISRLRPIHNAIKRRQKGAGSSGDPNG